MGPEIFGLRAGRECELPIIYYKVVSVKELRVRSQEKCAIQEEKEWSVTEWMQLTR